MCSTNSSGSLKVYNRILFPGVGEKGLTVNRRPKVVNALHNRETVVL